MASADALLAEGDSPVFAELEQDGLGPAELATRILSGGSFAPVRGPLRRVKTSGLAPRTAFLRDAAKKAAVGWLVRSGGWRARSVVAGERRREGRIWSQGILEPLQLRFSPASLEILARAAEWSAILPGEKTGGETPRDALLPLPPAPATKDLAPSALGDFLVFHLVVDALTRLPAWEQDRRSQRSPDRESERESDASEQGTSGPPPTPPSGTRNPRPRTARKGASAMAELAKARADEEAREKREQQELSELVERKRALLALSPLTALFRAEELELATAPEALDRESGAAAEKDGAWKACVEAASRRFAPLVQGDRAVILTYLDDALAKAWLARELDRRSRAAQDGASRHLALAAALEGLALAARKARRPDALRPLLRFFERYVAVFGQREAALRDLKECATPLVRASDRERLLSRLSRLFGAARPVASEAERVLETPFVDRSEEEKVFLADYQERTRSVRPELEAIRRELAGEVG